MEINEIGTICFIGAGRMATAIAGGLVRNGLSVDAVRAYDVAEISAQRFSEATGVATQPTAEEALQGADVVVIAVKPQSMDAALPAIASYIEGKLLISIAAGVTIEKLTSLTGSDRVVRVMPNTPALVGEGVSAYATVGETSENDVLVCEKILSSIGSCCAVSEAQIDAVTGLSGSGPAYVFSFIQALADGGVHAGLPRDVAQQLAAQTVLGAAKMVVETGEHPAVLSDQVTSPGGTTAEGLATLEQGAFKGTVAAAVKAATERSIELGRK